MSIAFAPSLHNVSTSHVSLSQQQISPERHSKLMRTTFGAPVSCSMLIQHKKISQPDQPSQCRWKGDANPEMALGLTSPRLDRPSSAPKRRIGGVQLYRSVAYLCTALLGLSAACEGFRMALALQKGSAFHALAHGLSRCIPNPNLSCPAAGAIAD